MTHIYVYIVLRGVGIVLKKEQAMVFNHMKVGSQPGSVPPTSCLAPVKRAT